MKIAIRYYTRGGNTKKLADAISKAVGAKRGRLRRRRGFCRKDHIAGK